MILTKTPFRISFAGGGYFLFFVKPEKQINVKRKLSKFKCIDFDFCNEGSHIIHV